MKLLQRMVFVSLIFGLGLGETQAKSYTTVLPDSANLKWVEVKDMPKGAQAAILMGNPKKKGPFIARIKLPAGYTVPAHSHPVAEYDTVISGTWYLGMGSKLDFAETVALQPGSFVKVPAYSTHYGMTKTETIIQISGTGPWGMIYPKKSS